MRTPSHPAVAAVAAATISLSRLHLARLQHFRQCHNQLRRLSSSSSESATGAEPTADATAQNGNASDRTPDDAPIRTPQWSAVETTIEQRDWTPKDAETYQSGQHQTIQIRRVIQTGPSGSKSIQRIPVISTRKGPTATTPSPYFTPSSTVALRNIGLTLTPSELLRLTTHHTVILSRRSAPTHVYAYRDPISFERRAIYHLRFVSPAAASAFVRDAPTLPKELFPPSARPVFEHLDAGDKTIGEQEALREIIGEDGGSVLLMAIGPGGTRQHVRLPRTVDMEADLALEGVRLRPGNIKVLGENGKKGADSRSWKAERWWVLRCGGRREAESVVRQWHGRRWRGREVLIRAEVL